MNIKQAIAQAKLFAHEIFESENMSNLGVEEVSREGKVWHITLGLSRPWDKTRPAFAVVAGEERPVNRSYHVFQISDEDGTLISARLRDR